MVIPEVAAGFRVVRAARSPVAGEASAGEAATVTKAAQTIASAFLIPVMAADRSGLLEPAGFRSVSPGVYRCNRLSLGALGQVLFQVDCVRHEGDAMRPRLLEHVRYVESEDGVYVQGDLGACTIMGQHSFLWMSRLAPLLTGEHTLSELVAPLTADRRELVENLVAALAAQRLVADAQTEEPHTLRPEERAVYAPEIAFIRYGASSAERRFERLRETSVALYGSGPVLAALLEAGLRSGWREVRVVDAGTERADLMAAVERGRRDAAQDVQVLEGVDPRVVFAGADVVMHVCESEDEGDLTRVARACARQDVALGQIWVRREEAWLTTVPAVEAESCWRRVTARPHEEPGEGGGWLTGAVPAVLAAQAALACFEHLTGTAQPMHQPTLTRLDLRTLDTRRHRLHACQIAD